MSENPAQPVSLPSSPDASPSGASERGGTLSKAVWKGSAITLIGQGVGSVIRFGSNLIITRLLLPEHFGLMALVSTFLLGVGLFSDTGVGPNIIQNPRGEEPSFFNTAWTVQSIRGVLLWVVVCLLAWPLSRVYHQPQLLRLLPVAGLMALFGGLESTRTTILNRRLSFLPITLLGLATQAVNVGVMIGLALVWRSVWVLVLSSLLATLARTILSHTILRGSRNHFAWDPAAGRSLFEFGRWIFVSTALTFLATQSDRLILGKLVSVAQLGFYSIAAGLAAVPLQIVQGLGGLVFFPVVAAAMRQTDHDPTSIRTKRINLLLTMAPLMALGVALSPALVRLMYRPNFHPVGILASYLCIGTWLSMVSTSYTIVLLAGARPKYMSLGQLVKVILLVGPAWIAATRFGAAGVAVVVSLSEIGLIVVSMVGCRRFKVVSVGWDLGITLAGAALVGIFLLLHNLLLRLTGIPVVALGVVSVIGLGCVAGIAKKVGLV
jgi:O-antigen/teichoic acid export membrane protein